MRLIDADEIEKQFVRAHLTYVNGEENWGYTTLVFGSVIKNAPTIDAVPVVRAYWYNDSRFTAKDEFGEEIVFIEQQCSNCNLWNIRMDRHIGRKYCPHCGAKMESDKE